MDTVRYVSFYISLGRYCLVLATALYQSSIDEWFRLPSQSHTSFRLAQNAHNELVHDVPCDTLALAQSQNQRLVPKDHFRQRQTWSC
jgi:hypothetical protein